MADLNDSRDITSIAWVEERKYITTLFLDLDINILDIKFKLGLFDQLFIVRMQYLSSNMFMVFKIFYASLGAEILRIYRANTKYNSFKSSCQTLISRMIYQKVKLKCFGRHLGIFVELYCKCKKVKNFLLQYTIYTFYIQLFHKINCINKYQMFDTVHVKDTFFSTDFDVKRELTHKASFVS